MCIRDRHCTVSRMDLIGAHYIWGWGHQGSSRDVVLAVFGNDRALPPAEPGVNDVYLPVRAVSFASVFSWSPQVDAYTLPSERGKFRLGEFMLLCLSTRHSRRRICKYLLRFDSILEISQCWSLPTRLDRYITYVRVLLREECPILSLIHI